MSSVFQSDTFHFLERGGNTDLLPPPSAWPEERNRSGRWKKENAMKRWIGERRKRDVEISWYPSDSRRWIFNNGATWRTSIRLLWTNLRRLDVIHLIQFHQTQVFKFFFKFSFKWLVIKWITFYCISLDSSWTVLSKVFWVRFDPVECSAVNLL